MGLTEKQEKFIQLLLQGKSQREAYRGAYPRSVNWKDSVVDVNACKLSKDAKVLLRLDEMRTKVREAAERDCVVTTEDVMEQLKYICMADYKELIDENGRPKPIHQLPSSITRALAGVDVTIDREGRAFYKYRLSAKDKSLALLSQILGLLQPKDDAKDSDPIEVKVDYGD